MALSYMSHVMMLNAKIDLFDSKLLQSQSPLKFESYYSSVTDFILFIS